MIKWISYKIIFLVKYAWALFVTRTRILIHAYCKYLSKWLNCLKWRTPIETTDYKIKYVLKVERYIIYLKYTFKKLIQKCVIL